MLRTAAPVRGRFLARVNLKPSQHGNTAHSTEATRTATLWSRRDDAAVRDVLTGSSPMLVGLPWHLGRRRSPRTRRSIDRQEALPEPDELVLQVLPRHRTKEGADIAESDGNQLQLRHNAAGDDTPSILSTHSRCCKVVTHPRVSPRKMDNIAITVINPRQLCACLPVFDSNSACLRGCMSQSYDGGAGACTLKGSFAHVQPDRHLLSWGSAVTTISSQQLSKVFF